MVFTHGIGGDGADILQQEARSGVAGAVRAGLIQRRSIQRAISSTAMPDSTERYSSVLAMA